MAIKADTRYAGTICGAGLYEAGSGTLGYQLLLECEDGTTDYVIWLTPRSKENAIKAFKSLGVEAEALKTEAGIDSIEARLVGMAVHFGTKTEEWNGKERIKVSWVGKPKAEASGDVRKRAAAFFSDAPAVSSSAPDDDSVPF
jgi:hypothetical protein